MDKEDAACDLTEAQSGELLRRAYANRRYPDEAVALDDALRSIEQALENVTRGEHGTALDVDES